MTTTSVKMDNNDVAIVSKTLERPKCVLYLVDCEVLRRSRDVVFIDEVVHEHDHARDFVERFDSILDLTEAVEGVHELYRGCGDHFKLKLSILSLADDPIHLALCQLRKNFVDGLRSKVKNNWKNNHSDFIASF